MLSLEGAEIERAIFHQRPTEREPGARTRQLGALTIGGLQLRACVQRSRLTEQKCVAVDRVQAALRDDVDAAASRAAVLGRPAVVHDLELANRFERQLGPAPAGDFVAVVEAVDVQRVAPRTKASEAETAVGDGCRGSATHCDGTGASDARREEGKLEIVA